MGAGHGGFKRRALALVVAAIVGTGMLAPAAAPASTSSPLDEAGWHLVAHMSDQAGMFDGNGDLMPGYSFGTFVAEPDASTADFARPFPVQAEEILFITGDRTVWGLTSYADLRALIDARGADFAPNLAFDVGEDGVERATTGNVLSRSFASEDPWISIEGGHFDGIAAELIVWGENDWPPSGAAVGHTALKNDRGGLDVFVRAAPSTPSSKSDCKKGGWQELTDSEWAPFKNQGDCVSYVATQARNGASG